MVLPPPPRVEDRLATETEVLGPGVDTPSEESRRGAGAVSSTFNYYYHYYCYYNLLFILSCYYSYHYPRLGAGRDPDHDAAAEHRAVAGYRLVSLHPAENTG